MLKVENKDTKTKLVNNKSTRTTSVTLFYCFYVSHLYFSVSIVNFEQVNPGCVHQFFTIINYEQKLIENLSIKQ